MARPTKFRPEFVSVARSMGQLGATDVEIADAIGVNIATLYRWKAENQKFCDAIKVGKEAADERVTKSLYHSAVGYEHDETDIRVVNNALVKTKIRKFYPPVPTSLIFWLKNRQADAWRERTEITGAGGGPVLTANVDLKNATPEQLRALASIVLPDGG